jgi:hypothetical protein
MRLIFAQHVDAEHAVLQQRIGNGTQMMDADQQCRSRRVRRDRHHGGHRDPMPARDTIRSHHVHGTSRMAHAEQELLAQSRLWRSREIHGDH